MIKRKILVVIDMQYDFVKEALGSEDARKIIKAVQTKIQAYKNAGYRIIYTRDTHTEDYLNTREGQYLPVTHCVKNTHGWEILNELYNAADGYTVIDKPSFGYYGWANTYTKDEYEMLVKAGVKFDFVKVNENRYVTSNIFTKDELIDLVAGNAEVEFIGVCTDICVITNALIVKSQFEEADVSADMECCAATSTETQNASATIFKSTQIEVRNYTA